MLKRIAGNVAKVFNFLRLGLSALSVGFGTISLLLRGAGLSTLLNLGAIAETLAVDLDEP